MQKYDLKTARSKLIQEPGARHVLFLQAALALLFMIVMIFISFRNYLLFHSLTEMFSITIAFLMFAIALNTEKLLGSKNRLLSFLGFSYGVVGLFDLIHTLVFKGMGVFPGGTANLPTELWIASRYYLSIALLTTGILIDKPTRTRKILFFYIGLALLLFVAIFGFDIFPDCYIEGVGLTSFKKASEIVISLLLSASAILFYLKRQAIPARSFWYLITSMLFTIVSQIVFVFYIDVYGLSNMVGHIAKLVSFYLIYKAIVEVNLLSPIIELTRSEQKYADLVESLPEAILIVRDENIVFASTAAVALFGQERIQAGLAELLGQPDDSLRGEYGLEFDRQVARPDGSIAEVTFRTLPFIQQDRASTMVIVYDMTEHKSAEQIARRNAELQIEAEILREADRKKNDFISTLSHELRNPLAAIVGGFTLMNLTQDREKVARAKEIVQRQISQLSRLVDDLLDISRISNNKIVLKKERIDLAGLAAAVTEDHHALLDKKGINLDICIGEQPILLDADPVRIKQIIGNLLQNAAKFTEPGGQVMVTVTRDDAEAVISVKDNGIGMKPEFMRDLFEPFKQARSSLENNSGGLGLGLSIVKAIAELHGGRVTAHSDGLGKGSEFTIRLPL